RPRRTDLVIDVETIRLSAVRDDIGAKLVENAGRDVIGSAVRAVDDDAHALQIEARGKGALAEFDITTDCIVDATCLAKMRRAHAFQRPLELELDLRFGFVGKLRAVSGEKLDPVVFVRVVRRADHDSGGEA